MFAQTSEKAPSKSKYLQVRQYPDPMLLSKATPWLEPIKGNVELQGLLDAMQRTMVDSSAIGLAGPQVGIPFRIFTIVNGGGVLTAINPVLTAVGEKSLCNQPEGCLSMDGVEVKVHRYDTIEMVYLDRSGNEKSVRLTGQDARAAQHEADHLDGIMMIDVIPKTLRTIALENFRSAKKVYERRLKAYNKAVKAAKVKRR